ncbi:MAG: hypothetical protein IT198_10675 [Acidimicrobiia bacterium]|nr:hypothetical protein [Acidimicrobiia bacterium]
MQDDQQDGSVAAVGATADGSGSAGSIDVGSGGADVLPVPADYDRLLPLAAGLLILSTVTDVGMMLGLEEPSIWKVPALVVGLVAILALGLAGSLAHRSPPTAFAVLVGAFSACVLVAIDRVLPANPTWAWLVLPVLLVGSSPGRRWTMPSCFMIIGLLVLVVTGLPPHADVTSVDLLGVATIGVVILGLGDLARRGADASSIEVTRAESLNQALSRAASASVSFVSSIAQDLTTPLHDIERSSRTLAGAAQEGTTVRACQQIILAADDVGSVVDEVLDRERLQAGLFVLERDPVDLFDLILRAAAAAGHDIAIEGTRCLVAADADRLADALTALLEAFPADPRGMRAILERDRGGICLRIPGATPAHRRSPRPSPRERLATALVEAHGGTLRTEPALSVWLPVDDDPPARTQSDADAAIRARDDQARWFIVLMLALVGVGLVLGPAWSGNLAVFLVAQVALVLADRFARPDVANPSTRVAARVAVIAVFAVLIAASGGLLSPLWIVAGLLVVGDNEQSLRATLGLGIVGSLTVGIAIGVTWPEGLPQLYGAAPVAVPLVAALFVARVNGGIDMHRRALQALSAELEASRARVTLFLAVVSHELLTPLTAVRGYAESLLLPRPWSEEELREFVTAIGEESQKLVMLIAELGDTAAIERGTLTVDAVPMDLADAVRIAVRRERSRSPELSIDVTCESQLPPVNADPRRVDQLLANILDNAVKHTPASSSIDVTIHADPDRVLVGVADHGAGMPPELRREIFKPFSRTPDSRLPGMGLGLHVCQGIVAAHAPGAGIWCEETPGGGMTIRVALPRADVASSPGGTITGPDE